MLFGILKAKGAFESLDDPVTKYAPSLAGGAYDQATVRNVLPPRDSDLIRPVIPGHPPTP